MPTLDDIAEEVRECTKCSLCNTRTQAVPGEGVGTADLMFIGEAPGYREDQDGRPFVGPAGQLLNELLQSIGLRRQDVYITNMVKCRPKDNRDPYPGEIQACSDYLDRQIAAIQPKVIVTLGRHSLAKFFPKETISKARGRARVVGDVTIYPCYHPAAALRQQNLRGVLEQDFQQLAELLRQPKPSTESNDDSSSGQQLSMF